MNAGNGAGRTVILALLLLAVMGLGACAASAAGAAEPVKTTQVNLPPSYRFDPVSIQVPAGATVTWTNHDNFTHNVHILGSVNWVSAPLRPGESTSYTFTAPGEYPYVCDFHSHDMKGSVVVTAK